MGRSLGSGLRGFKESINGDHVADELPVATTMAAVRDEERERDHAAAATTV